MKKFLPCILALVLSLSLTACNTADIPTDTTDAITTEAEFITTEAPETTPPEPEFDPVEVRLGALTVTALGMDYSGEDPALRLELDNLAYDTQYFNGNYMDWLVNGCAIKVDQINIEVPGGKTMEISVVLPRSELALYGIDEISTISTTFSPVLTMEKIDFHVPVAPPTGKEYSLRQGLVEQLGGEEIGYTVLNSSTELLYDKDGITIPTSALVTDANGHHLLLLEVISTAENLTNINLYNRKFNGLTIRYIAGTQMIPSGQRAILRVDLENYIKKNLLTEYNLTGFSLTGADIRRMNYEDTGSTLEANVPISLPYAAEGSFDPSGKLLHDGDGLRIVHKGQFPNEMNSNTLHLMIENTDTRTLTVQLPFRQSVSSRGDDIFTINPGEIVDYPVDYAKNTTLTSFQLIAYPDFETLIAGNQANIELHFQEE